MEGGGGYIEECSSRSREGEPFARGIETKEGRGEEEGAGKEQEERERARIRNRGHHVREREERHARERGIIVD